MRKDVEIAIQKLNEIIDWAKYDYELSDIPGFREPADKRQDDAIIAQAEKAIDELNKLLEIL